MGNFTSISDVGFTAALELVIGYYGNMGTNEFIYPKHFEDLTVQEMVEADLANQCHIPQDNYIPDMTWHMPEQQRQWQDFLHEQDVPLHPEGVAEATFKYLQRSPLDIVPETQRFIWNDANPLHFMTPFVATLFVAVQLRRDQEAHLGNASLGNHPFQPTGDDFVITRRNPRGIIIHNRQ